MYVEKNIFNKNKNKKRPLCSVILRDNCTDNPKCEFKYMYVYNTYWPIIFTICYTNSISMRLLLLHSF